MSTTLKADLLKLQDQIAFLLAKLYTVQGERELSMIFWELGGWLRFFCLKHKWPVDDFFVWKLSTILTFTGTINRDYPVNHNKAWSKVCIVRALTNTPSPAFVEQKTIK